MTAMTSLRSLPGLALSEFGKVLGDIPIFREFAKNRGL